MVWIWKACGFSRTAQPVTLRAKQWSCCEKNFLAVSSHAMAIGIGHRDRAISHRATSFFGGPLNHMFSRSNFMFSSYLHIGLLSYFFPSGLLTIILCAFPIPPCARTHWDGTCLPLLPVSAVRWDGQRSNRSVGEALDPSERLWLMTRIRPHQTMLSLQLPKPAINRFSTKSPRTYNIILCM